MGNFTINQAFDDLLWATPMPVMVLLGGEPAQVRGRGKCSLVVVDPAALAEKVAEVDALLPALRPMMANAFINAVGSKSRSVSGAAELAAIKDQVAAELMAQAAPDLEAMGLKLTAVEIEAIERL